MRQKGRFAGMVRVGEKGQIVIPKGARELLGIQPGETLLVLADEKRGLAITKDDVLLRQFEDLLGTKEAEK
jgi:AbrB family looped-hinge helix DNA binding protein